MDDLVWVWLLKEWDICDCLIFFGGLKMLIVFVFLEILVFGDGRVFIFMVFLVFLIFIGRKGLFLLLLLRYGVLGMCLLMDNFLGGFGLGGVCLWLFELRFVEVMIGFLVCLGIMFLLLLF